MNTFVWNSSTNVQTTLCTVQDNISFNSTRLRDSKKQVYARIKAISFGEQVIINKNPVLAKLRKASLALRFTKTDTMLNLPTFK